jgi:hypothetical protein
MLTIDIIQSRFSLLVLHQSNHSANMAFRAAQAVTLSAFILSTAQAGSTTQPQKFGLIGPESVMLLLNGFHFISGHPDEVIHANHHCVIMNDDFIQCAIYVPGTNPARLAGVEYIISGNIFETLPMEERELWHSHQYEVSSGLLIEPGTPSNVDKEVMKILVNTYGKTWHTWPYDSKNNSIPLGIPDLVNGYTGTGQVPKTLVQTRDDFFGVNSTAIGMNRTDIIVPKTIDGADAWKKGFVLELALKNTTGYSGPTKRVI